MVIVVVVVEVIFDVFLPLTCDWVLYTIDCCCNVKENAYYTVLYTNSTGSVSILPVR